jgi:hypothetical protein
MIRNVSLKIMYQGMDDDLRDKLAWRRNSIGRYSTVLKEMDAEELTLRRKDLGFTQQYLGKLLGVARNTIARWENGKIGFPPLLVDLALETLESNRKKYLKKMERDIKSGRKRLALTKENGTGGETSASGNTESISVIQASSVQLDTSKYYNKSELKARGWTPAMIRDLYGEPDFLKPIQCGNMRPKYYYLISNIETIEGTKAFTERARKPASDNK